MPIVSNNKELRERFGCWDNYISVRLNEMNCCKNIGDYYLHKEQVSKAIKYIESKFDENLINLLYGHPFSQIVTIIEGKYLIKTKRRCSKNCS